MAEFALYLPCEPRLRNQDILEDFSQLFQQLRSHSCLNLESSTAITIQYQSICGCHLSCDTMQDINLPVDRVLLPEATRPFCARQARPLHSLSAASEQQQSPYNDLRLYKFDQTDVEMLSLTHRVATQVERKSHVRKTPVQRPRPSPVIRPTTALWCKVCRTKGHKSPAFSESCNNRRLRKERKNRQTPRYEVSPRVKPKYRAKSAREWPIISASDEHMSRSSRDSTLSRKSPDAAKLSATLSQST